MNDLLDVYLAQPPAWRIATLAVFTTAVVFLAFAIPALARELVEGCLGPIRLRIRIRRVRRERALMAREEAERHQRRLLDTVVRFPVH